VNVSEWSAAAQGILRTGSDCSKDSLVSAILRMQMQKSLSKAKATVLMKGRLRRLQSLLTFRCNRSLHWSTVWILGLSGAKVVIHLSGNYGIDIGRTVITDVKLC